MNNRLQHFCTALERVAGLSAVRAEWQRALGDEWPWARHLLRPTDQQADCYPTCPHLVYRMDDLEFRDRMKRAYLIAMLVTINIRWRLEHIRVAKIFMDQHKLYVWGPQLVAVTAFLYGREYGRWESGGGAGAL